MAAERGRELLSQAVRSRGRGEVLEELGRWCEEAKAEVAAAAEIQSVLATGPDLEFLEAVLEEFTVRYPPSRPLLSSYSWERAVAAQAIWVRVEEGGLEVGVGGGAVRVKSAGEREELRRFVLEHFCTPPTRWFRYTPDLTVRWSMVREVTVGRCPATHRPTSTVHLSTGQEFTMVHDSDEEAENAVLFWVSRRLRRGLRGAPPAPL